MGLGAGLALLSILGAAADWEQVLNTARRVPAALLAAVVATSIAGGLLRAVRWVAMLSTSGVRVPWRRALAAYAGAELLGPLPASPLVASYLLHGGGVPFSATTPVVLACLWIDGVIAIGGTALVPGAAPPVVQALARAILVGALAGAGVVHLPLAHRLASRAAVLGLGGRRRWPTARWLATFWGAVEALPAWTDRAARALSPRALAVGFALTAPGWVAGTWLGAAVVAALGFPQLTALRVWGTAGTHFVLALASPLPLDLGVNEGATVLSYGWAGVPPEAALASSLIGRAVGLTVGPSLAALGVWLFRRELE